MTEALKPCPFCGGEAVVNYMAMEFGEPMQADPSYARISCRNLLCIGQSAYAPTRKAIAARNTRAPIPLSDALAIPEVAALVGAAKAIGIAASGVQRRGKTQDDWNRLRAARVMLDAALRKIKEGRG